uniref:Chromo domain-containing protein n=1 Tax=Xiphophorus couchianus TaxID=32473 RepID=A0A3B5LFY1_9TELE
MSEPSGHVDSAAQLRTALTEQGVLLGRHNNEISVKIKLSAAGTGTPAASPAPVTTSPSPSFSEVISPPPEPFSGEQGKCRGFLLQCALVFGRSPQSFRDDASKISYVVGLLRGKALKWAEAVINESSVHRYSYDDFIESFKQVFDMAASREDASKRLWELRQGNRPPVHSSPLCPPPDPPLPSRLVDGHPAFSVRRILAVHPRGRGRQYLVDWEGYGPEHRSWIPRSFILDPDLISSFERSSAPTSSCPPRGVH